MPDTTSAQALTPELRRWITEQLAAGCEAAAILQSMRDSGWDDAVARSALQAEMPGQAVVLPAGAPAQTPPAEPALPAPDLSQAPPVIHLSDRSVQVLMALSQPQLLLFGGLLSHDECDELVALAQPRLARSQTVDHHSGGNEVNAARTSDGMFFEPGEAPLIERIEARIAALLRWPVEKGEGLQVLRYRPGAQYHPHFDYFDPAQPGTAAVLARGGQRLATLIMYLNTPERGGATVFPDLRLDVAPTKGHAVFFSYDRPHESTRTLHGGAPVLAGEKWVATKWLRQGVFGVTAAAGVTPKNPDDCVSLAELRSEIDRLDTQIVGLLAERGGYVLAAARFKRSADEVHAPQRVEQIVARVRGLAESHGAMPDVVERIYREMIAAFSDAERTHWARHRAGE